MSSAAQDSKTDDIASGESSIPTAPRRDSVLKNQATIRGLVLESDVSQYQVGNAINSLTGNIFEVAGGDNPDQFIRIMNKYDNVYYYCATLAWCCRSDGTFGKKEEKFIRDTAHTWGLTDEKRIDQALKSNKDYSKEYLDAERVFYLAFDPSLSEQQLEEKMNSSKQYLVLYALLAATQDGLDGSEYQSAKKLAEGVGLNEDIVKKMIGLIRKEQELAQGLIDILGKQINPLNHNIYL